MERPCATKLFTAAERGDTNKIAALLSAGIKATVTDANDKTPLHIAITHGHLKAAELLIAHGALVNATDKNNHTPLYEAAMLHKKDSIHLLIANGADATIAGKNNAEISLHRAIRHQNRTAIDALLYSIPTLNSYIIRKHCFLLLCCFKHNKLKIVPDIRKMLCYYYTLAHFKDNQAQIVTELNEQAEKAKQLCTLKDKEKRTAATLAQDLQRAYCRSRPENNDFKPLISLVDPAESHTKKAIVVIEVIEALVREVIYGKINPQNGV